METETTERRNGLVLSGGGFLGIRQMGQIVELAYQGRRYDVIVGNSIGALNGAFLAQYDKEDQGKATVDLMSLWLDEKVVCNRALRRKQLGLLGRIWILFYLAGVFKKSIYNSRGIRKLLADNIDFDKLRHSKVHFACPVVELTTGELHTVSNRHIENTAECLLNGVVGSSAFPGLLTPHEDEARGLWVDGGLREVTPLGYAIKQGCTSIDVLHLGPTRLPTWKGHNALEIAMRALEIQSHEVMENDIATCATRNRLAARYRTDDKLIELNVIRPVLPISVEAFDFDAPRSRRSKEIVEGRQDVRAYFSQRKVP